MVTTIIPTRNRPELLMGRAIPSVLAQTYTDRECIVVGDGTDDDTVAAMSLLVKRDGRFRFWNLPNIDHRSGVAGWSVGGTEAFNFGLDQARGEWISYLADDDAYRPIHHERLLAASDDADIVYGHSTRDGQLYGTQWPPQPFDIVQGSYIIRRDIVGRAATKPDGPSWDARWWDALLQRDLRWRQVAEVVHEYHPAPENLGYHGARV